MINSPRIISGIIAFIMATTPLAGARIDNVTNSALAGGVKTVRVGANSDLKTMEEARDYIRTLDKTKYEGIEVIVESGEYQIREPILFTSEDSGTESCPVSYIGEDGAVISGAINLTKDDFVRGEGGLTEYFPSDKINNIVMVDLKDYGITPERMKEAMDGENPYYLQTVPFLSENGVRQTVAQYPDDWFHVEHSVTNSEDGTTETAIDLVTTQTIEYGDEHKEFVTSWSEAVPVFIRARLYKLWCYDDSIVVDIDKDEDKIDILFTGGHNPEDGTVMYFFNVPEALDSPGEYIIDYDAVLYYYPTESFDTSVLTVPLSEGILEIDGGEYLTFKNLVFTSSYQKGLEVKGNNIIFDGCEVSSTRTTGVSLVGNDLTYMNGSIHDCGHHGITVMAGDTHTVSGGNVLIYNNDIYEMTVAHGTGYAVDACGVNITVSHNDIHEGGFKAVHFSGSVNCVAEYNDVWRMLLISDDVGAMSVDGYENANIVFRYNYVHEIGPEGEPAKIRDYNSEYVYYGADAFYHDCGASYVEMYGNIINGCDDGYRSNGGRNNSFHNNLLMDCRMWYCLFVETEMIKDYIKTGTVYEKQFGDYIYSDIWKEINPDLYSLKTTTEGEDPFDPAIWCAPANLEAYDNYIYYNKYGRYFNNWGVKAYSFEEDILTFNPDSIEGAETHMTIYSSARLNPAIEDVIEATADVTGITLEIFSQIGRLSD